MKNGGLIFALLKPVMEGAVSGRYLGQCVKTLKIFIFRDQTVLLLRVSV